MKRVFFAILLFSALLPALPARAATEVCKDPKTCAALCEKGTLEGCHALAGMYGRGQGVKKAPDKMVELLVKGCDGGYARSCGELGFFYDNGVVVQKDAKRAATLYAKACEADFLPSCVNLGTMLEARAQPGDGKKAAAAYEKACKGGEVSGCFDLGNLYRVAGAAGDAAKLFQQACDASYAAACFNLALMKREGEGIPKDETGAIKLLARACALGEKSACAKP